MTNLLGQTIADRYRVDEFLGRGGMAEVYKVWDQRRATFLALKLLHEDLALDRVFIRRFKREADNLARLQHPHIVRFYGLEQEDRLAFMLLDYVEGETLKHKIFDAAGPMRVVEIQKVTRAVCSALQFAHSEGLVHCDIKPANIMIDQHGNVLLSDFGIARLTDAATATMVGAGTPAYMAPEQIKGLNPVPQTDIYALGVVLFEMFTGGERPFIGDQAQTTGTSGEKVRWEQVNLEPPSPREYNPDLSPELEDVVQKCLAKETDERYENPLDLFNALECISGKEETAEKELTQPAQAVKSEPSSEPVQSGDPAPVVISDAPTQLEPEETEDVNLQHQKAPMRSGWQRFGVWAAAGGMLVLMLAFVMFYLGQREEPVLSAPSVTRTLPPTATQVPIQTAAPEPELSKRIKDDFGIPMVLVPAGEFEMGMESSQALAICEELYDSSSDDNCEKNWFKGEEPVHNVYLDAYYIDRYEVTNAAYRECVETGVCPRPEEKGSYSRDEYYGNPAYDDYPVIYVSWKDAKTYCAWRGARLPTEEEWEKAARGPDGSFFPWGDDFERGMVNFCDGTCGLDWANHDYEDGYGETAPVGSFPDGASPYGAMDMAGNVWEWVADWYDVYPGGDPGADERFGREYRVLRGGSWYNYAYGVRAAFRSWGDPTFSNINSGFRCVRSAP
jgi:formylglycine-generating enzyme required for sulfatase activity